MADPKQSNGKQEEFKPSTTFEHAGADVFIERDEETGKREIKYSADVKKEVKDDDDSNKTN